jgi:uncharacterized protein YbjT (DUF2867 family)
MTIRAIITGSTGMVGKGVLLECLQSPQVEAVLVINRSPLGMSHPKLREVLHSDFFNLASIRDALTGYNACFFCLGVTAAGMAKKEYHRLTYDLTLNVAVTLKELNPGMTFCYISGAGTDGSEKGKVMWATVKGKTENTLLGLGFKDAYMFRPGFIRPIKGVRSKTSLYNALYVILSPLFPLIMKFPKYATSSETLSKAMIKVVSEGYEKKVLESIDINEIGTSLPAGRQGTVNHLIT